MNPRFYLLDLITQAAMEIDKFNPDNGATYGLTSSRLAFGSVSEMTHDNSLIISAYCDHTHVLELRPTAIRFNSIWITYDCTEEELFQLSTVEDLGDISHSDLKYAYHKYWQLSKIAKTKAAMSRDIYNDRLWGSTPSVLQVYQREAMLSTMMDKSSMDRFVRELNGLTTPSQITKNRGI